VGSGDLNDDGVPDLIIGAPRPPLDGEGTGRTYVFFGPVSGQLLSSQADVILAGEENNDEFGTSVAGAGDVNGDGAEDLLVGAHQIFRPGDGKAYLFYGPLPQGLILAGEAGAVLLGEPPVTQEEDLFGEVVASAGDANGDGLDDILIAASNNNAGGTRAGRAYLFLGPLSGTIPAAKANRIFTGSDWNLLGTALAPLRDLNADGRDDFLIGGPGVFESGVLEYAAIFFGTGTVAVQAMAPGAPLALLESRPNPFRARTTIIFDLPWSRSVNLRIFDALGREVTTLVNGPRPAGRSEIVWHPNGLPAGVYLCRLDVNGIAQTTKLLVLKP
jgi:hypothetical protein